MADAIVSLGTPRLIPETPHILRGFGAQFNTNLFTTVGEPRALTAAEKTALGSAINGLKLGHSRIFVGPNVRTDTAERDALLSTVRLAGDAGANVNLTWWRGPFPREPQPNHEDKRRQLMDDFAQIIFDARSESACVTHATVMNEVNYYDIAKQVTPRKTMELYNLLYRDLHESLKARPDPKQPSRSLRQAVQLVGGDLVHKGPGAIKINGQPVPYRKSDQDDWIKFMQSEMR